MGRWQRVLRYVKQDLREIFLPTSLPDPPGYQAPPRLTLRQHLEDLQDATTDYVSSWKTPEKDPADDTEAHDSQTPLKEELAAVARGGAKTMQPYLQQLYQTRASAYRDAVQEFVKGYREGYAAESEDSTMSSAQASQQQQQQHEHIHNQQQHQQQQYEQMQDLEHQQQHAHTHNEQQHQQQHHEQMHDLQQQQQQQQQQHERKPDHPQHQQRPQP